MPNAKNFNNIKVHSQYSICEGAIKIDELAEFCKSEKIKTLGLADSYNLCGALEFSEKLSKVGTHPIIGSQINLKKDNILAKSLPKCLNAIRVWFSSMFAINRHDGSNSVWGTTNI